MPTYEYQCGKCGSTMDIFQSITARPLTRARCETCGAVRSVKRLIGAGGAVIFKGSGFYQTDYRSETYKEKAKSESEAKPAAEKDKSASTDKPAAKPDAAKATPAKSPEKSAGKKKKP